jgi:hypothetical protein
MIEEHSRRGISGARCNAMIDETKSDSGGCTSGISASLLWLAEHVVAAPALLLLKAYASKRLDCIYRLAAHGCSQVCSRLCGYGRTSMDGRAYLNVITCNQLNVTGNGRTAANSSHLTLNQLVVGSSPTGGTTIMSHPRSRDGSCVLSAPFTNSSNIQRALIRHAQHLFRTGCFTRGYMC